MKKLILLAAVPVIIGGGVLALNNPQPRTSSETSSVSSTKLSPTVKSTVPQPVVAAPSQNIAQDTSTPPISQPIYGEDPNQPGIYVVFDKVAVMTQAGVPTDQQDAASTLISQRMNWRYKVTGFPDANLCYITPIIKMDLTAAPDYRDNPISQLAWCNNMVQIKYGGWQQALDYFTLHQNF